MSPIHKSTNYARPFLYFLLAYFPLSAELCLKSLTLEKAEEIALEYNKNFLIAKEGTEQANQRKLQAVSRWLPSINYFGEFRSIEKKELFFDVFAAKFPFSHQGYTSIFQLDQPLFSTDLIFGLKARQFESKAFFFEEANTQNELLRAVRDRYFAVVYFEAALGIERENVDYLSYALKQEQGRLDAGSRTPYEVNQSKVAVANAISSYYLTLKELKNARNALILTLGIDPLLEPEISLPIHTIPLLSIPEISLKIQEVEAKYKYRTDTFPTYLDFAHHIENIDQARKLTLFSEMEVLDYIELALKNRPDLKRSRLQVDVANQTVKEKEGLYFPKIEGFVRYSYNDIDPGVDPFFSQSYHWAGGIQLSWNLFDSFLKEHEIKEAKSKRRATRVNFDKDLQKIEVEVRNGLYQFEEALLAYLSSTQAVYLAEQAREQAQDKLEFGRIAPLEYRDSVNLLAQAKNQKNRSSFELIAAYYELRFATGVDVQTLGADK